MKNIYTILEKDSYVMEKITSSPPSIVGTTYIFLTPVVAFSRMWYIDKSYSM